MDDWADEKESMVSVSDVEVESTSNGDEQAGSSTSISTGKEEMAERNGEREEENGGSGAGAGTGIIESIASKFGVTVPGLSSKEEKVEEIVQTKEKEEKEAGVEAEGHKEDENGGIIQQIMSNIPESLLMSEDEVPAAEEASLLIAIIED